MLDCIFLYRIDLTTLQEGGFQSHTTDKQTAENALIVLLSDYCHHLEIVWRRLIMGTISVHFLNLYVGGCAWVAVAVINLMRQL